MRQTRQCITAGIGLGIVSLCVAALGTACGSRSAPPEDQRPAYQEAEGDMDAHSVVRRGYQKSDVAPRTYQAETDGNEVKRTKNEKPE